MVNGYTTPPHSPNKYGASGPGEPSKQPIERLPLDDRIKAAFTLYTFLANKYFPNLCPALDESDKSYLALSAILCTPDEMNSRLTQLHQWDDAELSMWPDVTTCVRIAARIHVDQRQLSTESPLCPREILQRMKTLAWRYDLWTASDHKESKVGDVVNTYKQNYQLARNHAHANWWFLMHVNAEKSPSRKKPRTLLRPKKSSMSLPPDIVDRIARAAGFDPSRFK